VTPPAQPTSPAPVTLPTTINQAESHRQIGNAAVTSGRFEEAVTEYTNALRLYPNNALCLSDRSYTYLILSRYHDARNDAEKAVKLDPSSSISWSRLGYANMRVASYGSAKTAFEQALRLQGDSPEAEITRKDIADATRYLHIQQGRPIPAAVPTTTPRRAPHTPTSPPSLSPPTTAIPTHSRSPSTSSRAGPSSPPEVAPRGPRLAPTPTPATPSTSRTPAPPATTPAAAVPKPGQSPESIKKAEHHKTLGNEAITVRKFEEAAEEYTRAIQLDPSNAVYLANRSHAYLALRRYHAALTDAEASVAADPSYWKGWSRLGAAHKALGEYSDAKTAYNQALWAHGDGLGAEATRKDLEEVNRLLEAKLDKGGTSTSRSANDVSSVGTTFTSTANASSSQNASSQRPPTLVSHPAPFPTTSSSSSSSAARHVTVASPQTSSQSTLAVPSSSTGPTLGQAAVAPPVMPTPSTSGASTRPTTSTSAPFTSGTSSETTRKAEHHKTLGNKASAAGEFEKAIEEYTRAIQLDPSNAVYLANRSHAYLALSRHHDARIDAEKSVAADPTYWKGWSRLGSAHKALEEYSEAKTAFERALRVQGLSTGAEITRRDLAEVTRLLNERGGLPSAPTSQSAANTPSVISSTVPAPTPASNIPSPRAPTPVPSRLTAPSLAVPRPVSSAHVAPQPVLSPRPRPTSSIPSSAPAHPTPVTTTRTPDSRSTPTTQAPAATANIPADPPPAYRPGELSSPDPVVAAVAEQELIRGLDELERKIAARNIGALSFGNISLNGQVKRYFVSLMARENQRTWDKDLDLVKIAHPAFGKILQHTAFANLTHLTSPKLYTMQMNSRVLHCTKSTQSYTGSSQV
jgi:tetratricopeptide (TPR) repeat protein